MANLTRSCTPLALILIWILLAACTTATVPEADPDQSAVASQVQDRITPLVESLYLHAKELKELHRDLRSVAQAHAFQGMDQQLNYIQKAALYIERSLIGASHQWELFSIMQDIRSSMIMDYFTLRSKGLRQAAREARYDVKFIEIYRSQITHSAAQEDIDQALSVIAEIRNVYNQLMAAVAPLVGGEKPSLTL